MNNPIKAKWETKRSKIRETTWVGLKIWVLYLRKRRNMKGKPPKNNIKHKNELVQKKALQVEYLGMCPQKKK